MDLIKNGTVSLIQKDAFKAIRDSLEDLNIDEAKKKLADLKLNPNLAKEILEAANNSKLLRGSADEITEGINNIAKSGSKLDDLSNIFKGIGIEASKLLKTLLTSPTTWLVAIPALAIALEDLFTVDYGEANEAFQKSSEIYNETKANVESLNSELKTTQDRMTELENLDKLSLAEKAELEELQSQNAELERKIALEEKLLEIQSIAASRDAKEAMSKSSHSVAQSVKFGDSTGKSEFKGEVGNVTDVEAIKEDIALIKEYENEIPNLEEKVNGAKANLANSEGLWKIFDEQALKDAESELKDYEDSITTLYKDLDVRASTIQSQLDILELNPEENAEEIRILKEALDEINNIDLSPAQKELANIESFFDGSSTKNTLKEYLLDAVNAGQDADDALRGLGISLEDAGLDALTLNKYFQEMHGSAIGISEAINKIDGSFQSVEDAFSTDNSGATWTSMADYISQAGDLYKEGKVGTDDFKSVVEWLSPEDTFSQKEKYKYDSEAYVEAWKDAQDKIKKYFDADNPLQSMTNFANKMETEGLAIRDGDEFTWTFQSSSEAAEALGLSIEATEAIMKNLMDYGAEFDSIMWSGDGLDRYKSSLEGIKSVYDSMSDSDSKTRLGKLIENWDSELAGYENDLDTLTEDKVIHIEFAYNLAQLDAEIEALELEAANTGKNDAETNGVRIAKKQVRREQAEDYAIEERGMVIPVEYKIADSAIAVLQEQLNSQDFTGDPIALQAEIENLTDLQNEMLNAFNDSDLSWDEFLKTDEFDVFQDKINEVKSNVEELTGEELEVSLEAKDEVTPVLQQIMDKSIEDKIVSIVGKDDATHVISLWNQLSAEDKFAEMTANDQATYVIELWNSMTPEQKEAYLDGRMTITDEMTGKVLAAKGELETIPSIINTDINVDSNTSSAVASSKLLLNSIDGKVVHTYIYTHKKTDGDSELAGTAHLSGTAYANGSVDSNWLKQFGKTKKDEYALVGEKGVEIVAHGNDWWTVGDDGAEFRHIPSDSVVFNTKQSKELLTKGKINGRGRSYLSGTAFANGWTLPSSYNGNTGGSKTVKTNTKDTTVKAGDKSNKAVEKALDAISKAFDWIAVRADRLARLSENAKAEIDRAITLSDKLKASSKTITAIQNELTAAEKGSARYLKEAQSVAKKVGLSTSLQKKVQDGTIDITQYSDTTKEKIEAYKKYYDLYLEYADKAVELEDKQNELALDRLSLIGDSYDAIKGVHESLVSLNESAIELNNADGYSAVSDSVKALYQDSILEAQKVYNNAVKELNAYQKEFNSLVSKGYLKKGTQEYNEYLAEINELKIAVNDAAIAVVDFQDALREIEVQRAQNYIDAYQRQSEKIGKQVELLDARDQDVPEELYQKQIELNNQSLVEYERQLDELRAQQADEEFGSERYNELAEEIAEVENASYDLLIQNEELKDSIAEVRFDEFEKGAEDLEKLQNEADDLRDLLDDTTFFDKEGGLTSEGVANIALIAEGMNAAKQQIADYNKALDKLDEAYSNGLISEEEYNEKSEEYRDAIRDNVKEVKAYKDALADLYITQVEKENEALKETIELRREALKRKAEYYDYNKNISNQNKDINMLKAQIAALEGVNNASAQSELKRLKQELADAESALDDTKREHSIEMQELGYDQMSEDLDTFLEDLEYEIATNAQKQQEIIDEMLNNVVARYSEAYGKVNDIIDDTGLNVSKTLNKNLEELSTQQGAQNKVDDANQSVSSTSSTSSASNIDTSGVDTSSNSSYENKLAQQENVNDRKVASIKLSASSVSVVEGSSKSVKVSEIKPADAANQNVTWKSSNTKVATVSSGKIKGVGAGSCTITCTAADGSEITASVSVTVTAKTKTDSSEANSGTDTKTEAVKKDTTNSSSSSGDNKITKGERVTFDNGKYTASSDGSGSSGKQSLGDKVYVTRISSGAERPYHISKDKNGKSPLGWVKKKQLKGYSTGAKYIDEDQLAWLNEYGDVESYIRQRDGAIVRVMGQGDRIMNSVATANLYDMANDPMKYFEENLSLDKIPAISAMREFGNSVVNHYDCLLKVEGNVDKEVLPPLEEILKKSCKYTSDHMYKDALKMGLRKR